MAGKEALLRQWEEREVELARMGRYESRWAFIIFTGSSLQPQGWAGSIPVPPSPCSWYPSAWTTPWLCPTLPVIPCIIPAIATSWLSNLSLFPILSPGDSWTLWGRAGDREDLRGLPQRKSWPQQVGQKPSRDQCSLERYNLPPLCINHLFSLQGPKCYHLCIFPVSPTTVTVTAQILTHDRGKCREVAAQKRQRRVWAEASRNG